MNSNRMKYASTPTYGMQKKSFAKKPAAAQEASMPDFTQQPSLDMNAPISPFGVQNPFVAPPTQFQGNPQTPSFFPNTQPQAPMFANQNPFGAPSLAYGSPQMNANGYLPPLQSMAPSYPQSAAQGSSLPSNHIPFQSNVQGFVPPSYPVNGSTPPSVIRSEPMGNQSIPVSGMATNQNPYGGVYTNMGFQGVGMAGMAAQGNNADAFPPMMMNMQNQPANTFGNPAFRPMGGAPHATPTPRPPLDVDRWLKIILFGILPLLFIPCIFVASAFNFLRYLFIILAVTGLSVIWYRQSFTSAMRMTLTIGYLVMSIIVIAMLISGNRDVTRTAGVLANDSAVQSSVEPSATPDTALLAAQVTASPIEDAGESEAELRLVTFMDNWQANRIEDMVNLVQPSWATQQDNPASALFTVISNRTPGEYVIEGISGTSADSSRTVTMSAFIDKNNGKDAVRYRFMILMVREGGEWYVDPNSLATNDVASETPSPEPGKEGVSQSLQPRMTVTPIPDPSTRLYYNADGGKYYHADPNCSAVNEKFLPMAGFLYSELDNAPYNALQPCLKCGAPTQSLGSLSTETEAAVATQAP